MKSRLPDNFTCGDLIEVIKKVEDDDLLDVSIRIASHTAEARKEIIEMKRSLDEWTRALCFESVANQDWLSFSKRWSGWSIYATEEHEEALKAVFGVDRLDGLSASTIIYALSTIAGEPVFVAEQPGEVSTGYVNTRKHRYDTVKAFMNNDPSEFTDYPDISDYDDSYYIPDYDFCTDDEKEVFYGS